MEFAVVPEDPGIKQNDAMWDSVVSALNIQVTQQAAPAWRLQATVSTYTNASSVPAGATPIVIMKSPPASVEGCHRWKDDQASAVVRWQPDGAWSIAASHEIIETLVDASLAATRRGPNPNGNAGLVDFLLEVCDPCAGRTYVIPGSQVELSDFCLPAYYDKATGGPYTQCRQLLHLWELGSQVSGAGYVTWSTAAGWMQLADGAIRGPVSKEELLANSFKLGMRGAVDRLQAFARPAYARTAAVTRKPQAKSATAKNKRSANRALKSWVTKLRTTP
jgi:hypothetical protein